jgi:hypothetical protein
MFGEVGFHPLRQFAAGKHYAPSATLTLQPDVRAETYNRPFKGTAGMLFP